MIELKRVTQKYKDLLIKLVSLLKNACVIILRVIEATRDWNALLGKYRCAEVLRTIVFTATSITNISVQANAALVSTSLTLLPIIIDAINPRCNTVVWKHGFFFAS